MSKLFNLAKITTATSGTGTITLGSAVSGFLTFALAGVSDGDIVSYGISDGANSEVGYGTYASAGTTLARTTVLASTNSGSAIDLSGSAVVFITALAENIGDVEEAPEDGHLYARVDGAWVDIYVGGSASVTVVSTTTDTGASPHSLASTDVAEGDIVIAVMSTRNSVPSAITGGAAWTQLWARDLSSDEEVWAYWKVAGASEPASYSWPQDRKSVV